MYLFLLLCTGTCLNNCEIEYSLFCDDWNLMLNSVISERKLTFKVHMHFLQEVCSSFVKGLKDASFRIRVKEDKKKRILVSQLVFTLMYMLMHQLWYLDSAYPLYICLIPIHGVDTWYTCWAHVNIFHAVFEIIIIINNERFLLESMQSIENIMKLKGKFELWSELFPVEKLIMNFFNLHEYPCAVCKRQKCRISRLIGS